MEKIKKPAGTLSGPEFSLREGGGGGGDRPLLPPFLTENSIPKHTRSNSNPPTEELQRSSSSVVRRPVSPLPPPLSPHLGADGVPFQVEVEQGAEELELGREGLDRVPPEVEHLQPPELGHAVREPGELVAVQPQLSEAPAAARRACVRSCTLVCGGGLVSAVPERGARGEGWGWSPRFLGCHLCAEVMCVPLGCHAFTILLSAWRKIEVGTKSSCLGANRGDRCCSASRVRRGRKCSQDI